MVEINVLQCSVAVADAATQQNLCTTNECNTDQQAPRDSTAGYIPDFDEPTAASPVVYVTPLSLATLPETITERDADIACEPQDRELDYDEIVGAQLCHNPETSIVDESVVPAQESESELEGSSDPNGQQQIEEVDLTHLGPAEDIERANQEAVSDACVVQVAPADNSKTSTKPVPVPPKDKGALPRKSYGGILRGSTFTRACVTSVDELTQEERACILMELEADKASTLEKIRIKSENRQRQQEKRTQKERAQKQMMAQLMEETTAELKSKKTSAMQEWLNRKQVDIHEKKLKEDCLMEALRAQDIRNKEEKRRREICRLEEQARRIDAARRKRATEEQNLLRTPEKGFRHHRHRHQVDNLLQSRQTQSSSRYGVHVPNNKFGNFPARCASAPQLCRADMEKMFSQHFDTAMSHPALQQQAVCFSRRQSPCSQAFRSCLALYGTPQNIWHLPCK